MAGNDCTLDKGVVAQVKAALAEIGELAGASKRLSIKIVCGEDDTGALADANQVIAEKIGFIADLMLGKLDAPMYRGNAEDWMLPPSYHEAKASSVDHGQQGGVKS